MDWQTHKLKQKKLRLNPTEYAIATSMLDPDGLNQAKVEEMRLALQRWPKPLPMHETIDKMVLRGFLSSLRKKVGRRFGGTLIVPQACNGVSSTGLRFWTKEEIEQFRQNMANPGCGFVSIQAPNLQRHVFINAHEIKPQGRGGVSALDYEILKRACSPRLFRPGSPDFRDVCAELTGKETMSPAALSVKISHLNRALRPTGMTLKHYRDEQAYELMPYMPKPEKVSTPRKLAPAAERAPA
jgi:hypothetical protein